MTEICQSFPTILTRFTTEEMKEERTKKKKRNLLFELIDGLFIHGFPSLFEFFPPSLCVLLRSFKKERKARKRVNDEFFVLLTLSITFALVML